MLQLKNSLTAPFSYVFPEDSAVDHDSPDFNPGEYEKTLEMRHLPLRPGQQPTAFRCKPLSRTAFTRVADLVASGREGDATQLAIASSLTGIDNGPDVTLQRDQHGVLNGKSLDSLYEHLGPLVMRRLGTVIATRSALDPF